MLQCHQFWAYMSEVLKKLWQKRPLWPFGNSLVEFTVGNVEIETTAGLEKELQFNPADEVHCCLELRARSVGPALA